MMRGLCAFLHFWDVKGNKLSFLQEHWTCWSSHSQAVNDKAKSGQVRSGQHWMWHAGWFCKKVEVLVVINLYKYLLSYHHKYLLMIRASPNMTSLCPEHVLMLQNILELMSRSWCSNARIPQSQWTVEMIVTCRPIINSNNNTKQQTDNFYTIYKI